ncbi:MAG: hypothetical protein EA001_12255 [Oscillatoriales cyanobacterium]|nr:MAG: hypothetical protein EA001_12255 [Oscillatoriales cyanobacterium]
MQAQGKSDANPMQVRCKSDANGSDIIDQYSPINIVGYSRAIGEKQPDCCKKMGEIDEAIAGVV